MALSTQGYKVVVAGWTGPTDAMFACGSENNKKNAILKDGLTKLSCLSVFYCSSRLGDPLFMNNARSVKGIDAMPTMISEIRIDVGSYGALKSGRKGIGNRAQTHRLATIATIFHLFLIFSRINDI
jgi:hypothetical protein